jgi:hypothetical protein
MKPTGTLGKFDFSPRSLLNMPKFTPVGEARASEKPGYLWIKAIQPQPMLRRGIFSANS